jgi:4-diphosphocytidyl-2-C-methyl-D-erythritol kinase
MSGSGATCFGLYADEEAADNAAETLAEAHPDWWISAAPILS